MKSNPTHPGSSFDGTGLNGEFWMLPIGGSGFFSMLLGIAGLSGPPGEFDLKEMLL
ncbi:MAG: hypothetical protein JSV16_05345 [Candidatus Hydrogenedentota bacterium]|nr:MAG: hypothetical protein JSV16_05345 [Candidatus Hydrogenedentota bacterium]